MDGMPLKWSIITLGWLEEMNDLYKSAECAAPAAAAGEKVGRWLVALISHITRAGAGAGWPHWAIPIHL